MRFKAGQRATPPLALAEFIAQEVPGEPGQPQGVEATAIRIIRNLTDEVERLQANIERLMAASRV